MTTEFDWEDILFQELLHPDKVKRTEIQRQVERYVTNGLGYNSRTIFIDEALEGIPKYCGIDLRDEFSRNSLNGLKAHIVHLDAIVSRNPSSDKVFDLAKQIAIDGAKDVIFSFYIAGKIQYAS